MRAKFKIGTLVEVAYGNDVKKYHVIDAVITMKDGFTYALEDVAIGAAVKEESILRAFKPIPMKTKRAPRAKAVSEKEETPKEANARVAKKQKEEGAA